MFCSSFVSVTDSVNHPLCWHATVHARSHDTWQCNIQLMGWYSRVFVRKGSRTWNTHLHKCTQRGSRANSRFAKSFILQHNSMALTFVAGFATWGVLRTRSVCVRRWMTMSHSQGHFWFESLAALAEYSCRSVLVMSPCVNIRLEFRDPMCDDSTPAVCQNLNCLIMMRGCDWLLMNDCLSLHRWRTRVPSKSALRKSRTFKSLKLLDYYERTTASSSYGAPEPSKIFSTLSLRRNSRRAHGRDSSSNCGHNYFMPQGWCCLGH